MNVQTDLVPLGVPGLDEVLFGGVSRNNIILLEGAPGAGKTSLGLQFIHNGARYADEPGVIVTFELSPQKLLRDARGFDFRLDELEQQGKVKILYTSPQVLLDDLQQDDGVVAAEITRIGAKRLLIDGLTPLRLLSEHRGDRPFRESLHLVVEALQRLGVTTMLTRECDGEPGKNPVESHERFVCDTILHIASRRRNRSVHRTIEVVKSRGQDFLGGEHTLRIEAGRGVTVYRRAHARPRAAIDQQTSTERLSTGCAALDHMIDGGLYRGSSTLIVGISGTGKTVAGVQFLMDGVARGEPGLLVTLDEHPRQLARNAESLGFAFEQAVDAKMLAIEYDSPLELELDVHFDRVLRRVRELGVKRVVFDSMAAYEAANPESSTDFMYAMVTTLKDELCTILCNYESPELLGISQISENLKASHLVDNIILLNHVEISTKLRRAITVPKSRGTKNRQVTREFEIREGGFRLLDERPAQAQGIDAVPQLPFSSYYGLLSRSPARTSPMIEDAVQRDGATLPVSPRLPAEP